MKIMYVRHADATNDKLTELGERQCKLMTEQEDSFVFTKIYSSPLNRCVETSKALAEKYKIGIEVRAELSERKNLNKDPENADEQEWFDNYLNPNYSHKDPEGCKEFLDRTAALLDEIISTHKHKNENVIISAHSCTLYAIMAYFNKPQTDKINWYRISNCGKIYFEID